MDYGFGKEIFKNMFTIPTKIAVSNVKDIGLKQYYQWRYPNARAYGELPGMKYETGTTVPKGNEPVFQH